MRGGNVHAEERAVLVADNFALARAKIGAIAERREALLMASSIARLSCWLRHKDSLALLQAKAVAVVRATAGRLYKR